MIWAPNINVGSQHGVSVESGIHEIALGSTCVKRGVLRTFRGH